jgi:hypothetical protein
MGPDARPRRLRTAERAALAGLALLALVAWLRYRNLPTYDSLASMVWGRDIVHGHVPQFASYQAPTEHPLWVALSTVLAAVGDAGARGMTAVSVASLVALAAGTYRLGRQVFGPLAGALAAVLLLTRLDFGFYAAFAFVDVPFAAAIVWAAVLEAERPRRGGAVWVLLTVAGLLRPEGWAYAGAYAIWLAWGAPRERWVALAWPAVVAPALWALTDLVVTGDPLFSFTYTTDAAAELGRTRSPTQIPDALWGALREVLKVPVVAAGAAGLALALWRRRRDPRLGVPLALLVLGVATFAALVVGGVSAQVPRYAAVAAIALLLFAGHLLDEGVRAARRRASVGVALALVVLAGVGWTATRIHPGHVDSEIRFRHRVEADLDRVLDRPEVTAGRRCGPVGVPIHKLLPAARWLLGGREDRVVARNDPTKGHVRPGVVLLELGGRLTRNPAYGAVNQSFTTSPLVTQVPPAGYVLRGRSAFFAIYARC